MTNTATETRTKTRRVPIENFAHLTLKVAELNKRARRLNLTPLRIEVVGSEVVERETRWTPKVKYNSEIKLVEIVGESPVLAGHELIARLTPAEGCEGENFVKCVPGKECPAEFRTVDMRRCDHCNARRRRNDTFVLLHTESGKYTVVGRNCIGDFLGHASPKALLSGAEMLFYADSFGSDAEGDYYGCGSKGWELDCPIELFVAMTSIFIRRFGWTPRSKADERSEATADAVWGFLAPARNREAVRAKERFARRHNLDVTPEDREVAVKAIEWARANTDGNDYIYNLRLACTPETVKGKTIGLVASVIAAYNRHVEKLVELHARKIESAACVHLGEIKGRYVFADCTVRGTRHFENDWGVTTLVTLSTPGGNIVKWWASGDRTNDFPVGDKVTITGTVKEHGEYKGRKETTVNRCKLGVSGKARPVVEPAVESAGNPVETPESDATAGNPAESTGNAAPVEPAAPEAPAATETPDSKACSCGGSYVFSGYCGANVCTTCDNHEGLARCYCGWSASGGNGYNELVEMGENIEPI